MIELGIVGARDSGKTTLVSALVAELSGWGLRVATTKHTSHAHRFDREGKDSERHRRAGAGLTVAVSGCEVALFAEPSVLDDAALRLLLGDRFDVWLVEGEKGAWRPKLLLTRGLAGLKGGVPPGVIATVGDDRVPGIECHFAAHDVTAIAEFAMSLTAGELSLRESAHVA